MTQVVARWDIIREDVVCPICTTQNASSFIPFGPHDIVRCQECGLIYVSPRQLHNEIRSFFQDEYIPDDQMLHQELGAWRAATLRREASLVKSLLSGGRILDIGCASGEFLLHFVGDCWECYGVEPSIYAAERGRQLAIHIHCGTVNDIELPNSYFDVITCLDTLYFVPNPVQDLMNMNRLLKDEGVLLIELPGLTYRLLKNIGPISLLINRQWCHLSSQSPHLFYFSLNSIRRLLNKTGFKIEDIVLEQSPVHGPASLQMANKMYYNLTKYLFDVTAGKVNLAAKVVYVCRKSH